MFLMHNKWLLAGIAVVAVTAGFAIREFWSTGDLPILLTPAWQEDAAHIGGDILLRTEPYAAGLLLRHSKQPGVYEYQAGSMSLKETSEAEWNRSDSPVSDCGRQTQPLPSALGIDSDKNRLVHSGRVIATEGRTFLDMRQSPDGKWVAILSAAGHKQSSVMPFLGGGGASGQHYHEILSLPDLKRKAEVVRVPTSRQFEILIPCWSADNHFVVYRDLYFFSVVIVKTGVEP